MTLTYPVFKNPVAGASRTIRAFGLKNPKQLPAVVVQLAAKKMPPGLHSFLQTQGLVEAGMFGPIVDFDVKTFRGKVTDDEKFVTSLLATLPRSISMADLEGIVDYRYQVLLLWCDLKYAGYIELSGCVLLKAIQLQNPQEIAGLKEEGYDDEQVDAIFEVLKSVRPIRLGDEHCLPEAILGRYAADPEQVLKSRYGKDHDLKMQALAALSNGNVQGFNELMKKTLSRLLDLSGLPLNNMDLRAICLRDARIIKANLSKSDLTNADFGEVVSVGSNYAWDIFSGVDLTRAHLMQGDNFQDTDLVRAVLAKRDKKGALVRNKQGQPCIANLPKSYFRGARISTADADLPIFEGWETREFEGHLQIIGREKE